jgi:tRNA U34 2-thiouridine synthase MnmA/TrmU
LVDAAGICEQLGIPHHVVDTRETFQKEIVQRLVDGYQDGITPLPCSQCNRSVKFGPMLEWAAQERNLPRIATGHYARIRHGGDSWTPPAAPRLGLPQGPELLPLRLAARSPRQESCFPSAN